MMAVEESPQSLASVKSPCNLQLEQLVRTHGGDDASLADLRLLFIVLVGYAGFLRISEILAMQVKHIEFLPEGMSIYLPKRKNDQFRLGSKVFTARPTTLLVLWPYLSDYSPFCPTTVIPPILLFAGLNFAKTLRLFTKVEEFRTQPPKN